MHFESAAEMPKENSSYKDLLWHAKTSNCKDSLPTQSSLLSSLQSCCTRSIVGLRNCWPSMSTEWAAKSLKGQSHLWEQTVTAQQEQSSGSWVHLSTARTQQVTQAGAAPSWPAHPHSGQQKSNQTDRDSPNRKGFHSSDNLFIVSSSSALLVGFPLNTPNP